MRMCGESHQNHYVTLMQAEPSVRTPLTEVPAFAAQISVGRVFVKDESARMGLPAFKVLAIRLDATVVLLSTEGAAANPVLLSLIALIRDLRCSGQAGAVEVAVGRAWSRHGGDRTGVEGLTAV
jgi:hypothetical protein